MVLFTQYKDGAVMIEGDKDLVLLVYDEVNKAIVEWRKTQ